MGVIDVVDVFRIAADENGGGLFHPRFQCGGIGAEGFVLAVLYEFQDQVVTAGRFLNLRKIGKPRFFPFFQQMGFVSGGPVEDVDVHEPGGKNSDLRQLFFKGNVGVRLPVAAHVGLVYRL